MNRQHSIILAALLWLGSNGLVAQESQDFNTVMHNLRQALPKAQRVAVTVFFNQKDGKITQLGEYWSSQVGASLTSGVQKQGYTLIPRLDIIPVITDAGDFDIPAAHNKLKEIGQNSAGVVIIGKYFIVGENLELFINAVTKVEGKLSTQSYYYKTKFQPEWVALEANQRDTETETVVGNGKPANAIQLRLNQTCYRDGAEMIITVNAPLGHYAYLLQINAEDNTAYRYYPHPNENWNLTNPQVSATPFEFPPEELRTAPNMNMKIIQDIPAQQLMSREQILLLVSPTPLDVGFIPAALTDSHPTGVKMQAWKPLTTTAGAQIITKSYIVSQYCPAK